MPLKSNEVLSRADFDEAVVKLRLNVSEIAKATNIPRTYLSEFRNGDRQLRPEHLGKLRDYFEEKGLEFEKPKPVVDPADSQTPHPRLKSTMAPRCYFPIAEEVPDHVIAGGLDLLEENDARLVALLKQTAERDNGFLGSGELTSETKAALQEAGSLLAENYLVFRMLRGWRAFGIEPAGESVETLRDVLLAAYRERFEEIGLVEPSPDATNDEREAA